MALLSVSGAKNTEVDVPASLARALPTTGSASALGFGYRAEVTAGGEREFEVTGAGLRMVCQEASGHCKFSKK